MSYLLDALQHLGIYVTPSSVLSLGNGAGKGNPPSTYIPGNPPFTGDIVAMPAHHRYNRATHGVLPTDFYLPYRDNGTPVTYWSYNGGITRPAILRYEYYMADPFYACEPTCEEMRRLVEYCCYWINAPCLVYPANELRELRAGIEHVTTPQQLHGWLWGVRQACIGPVWGGL